MKPKSQMGTRGPSKAKAARRLKLHVTVVTLGVRNRWPLKDDRPTYMYGCVLVDGAIAT